MTSASTTYTRPDRLEGLFVYRGVRQIGRVFPAMVYELDGPWFGKRPGVAARKFAGREQALAYVTGGES